MKKLAVLILTFISLYGYGQDKSCEKWYSNIEFDVIIHKKATYSYSYIDNSNEKHVIWDEELNNKKIAFGLTYSYNYMLFKKMSIGVLTGYKKYNQPDFSILELGGIMKFFFVDTNNVFLYGLVTSEISTNKNQFKSGTNARIGIGVPIIKRDKFNISLNLFKEQQLLRLDGAESLFNYEQEKPGDIIFKSYGLSTGIKF
ncbi:hypothetical protein [Flavobacterium sp. N2038]|uniref:hypothetical protein n=1 Tax=Flavobacterium sp. N2038 TaxID=2986829 RepID=UPI002225613A|nr:hypothetical protein [Flavobacterium sp. N2038]